MTVEQAKIIAGLRGYSKAIAVRGPNVPAAKAIGHCSNCGLVLIEKDLVKNTTNRTKCPSCGRVDSEETRITWEEARLKKERNGQYPLIPTMTSHKESKDA